MASGVFRTTLLLLTQEQPLFPVEQWGLRYCWCHLSSPPSSFLRIWYKMLLAWCVSHWHFPNFSAGISVAIDPEFPVAGNGARGSMHQRQRRAFLPHSEASPAFYIHGRLKSNMTPICKVTLNFICTGLLRMRRGCRLPVSHRAAIAPGEREGSRQPAGSTGAARRHAPVRAGCAWPPATMPVALCCCHQQWQFCRDQLCNTYNLPLKTMTP